MLILYMLFLYVILRLNYITFGKYVTITYK